MDSKNYIELAPRLYTNSQPMVIQAFKVGVMLKVVAPLSFVLKWDSIKAEGWLEVDHEPGPVTVDEWRELVGL